MTEMKLNPDKDYVKQIKTAIKNKNGHCPCIVKIDESTKCPCEDFRIRKVCHCDLYVKK